MVRSRGARDSHTESRLRSSAPPAGWQVDLTVAGTRPALRTRSCTDRRRRTRPAELSSSPPLAMTLACGHSNSGRRRCRARSKVGGGTGFGRDRNPLRPATDGVVPSDILQHVDQASLRTGGFTNAMLGLPGDYLPRDWTTVLPDTDGERGIGFLLLRPSDWRRWT